MKRRHLATLVIVLPRLDRSDADALDELHASLKHDFVSEGLMIGQFHPRCAKPGSWNRDFRPLQAPVPMLVIREMVSSDLPLLLDDPRYASAYLERFAPEMPTHTRRFTAELLATSSIATGVTQTDVVAEHPQ